jgi:hypothetical protein
MTQSANPFRCFNASPEMIGLVVVVYVRYRQSLRNVEDLLFERGIDICHETVRPRLPLCFHGRAMAVARNPGQRRSERPTYAE